jgi:hypothetical protein
MRTTLTLDPDVARLLKDEVHRQKKSFKEVVNDTIRKGLSPARKRPGLKPYRVKPFKSGFQPGIDPNGLNKLVDDLEVEEYLRQTAALRKG